ncbi:MAG: hypothetical protein IJA46_00750 [Bacteroidaceae bacterium]|nr:hypothetical protein [Bacteroidaceae bacterium]
MVPSGAAGAAEAAGTAGIVSALYLSSYRRSISITRAARTPWGTSTPSNFRMLAVAIGTVLPSIVTYNVSSDTSSSIKPCSSTTTSVVSARNTEKKKHEAPFFC